MNAKFNMPKFRRELTGKGWLKELLMTFLGTTISIVLTFGTTAYLEDWQIMDIDTDGSKTISDSDVKAFLQKRAFISGTGGSLSANKAFSLVVVVFHDHRDIALRPFLFVKEQLRIAMRQQEHIGPDLLAFIVHVVLPLHIADA